MRFQGLPSVRIAGGAAPAFSSGEAMDEMERLSAQLISLGQDSLCKKGSQPLKRQCSWLFRC